MTPTESPAYPASEIEALIAALIGVLAARVALSPTGRVEEIHILADEQLHPKQIVRNTESALSAGLGVTVDRRLISVAQVRAGEADAFAEIDEPEPQTLEADSGPSTGTPANPALQPAAQPGADSAVEHGAIAAAATAPRPLEAEPDAAEADAAEGGPASRYVFVGYDARTQPDLEAACRVTIRRGREVISGTGSGPSTALGRAQAAAGAVFGAIATARRDEELGLEGVTLVERHGRTHILVAAHAGSGRDSLPLTGVAALTRSPEEAAILASLQATNRWSALDG